MQDIEERLKTLGIPFAYRRFKPYKDKPVPAPPYLIWIREQRRQYGSDSENLLEKQHVLIELYGKKKEAALEAKLEELFSDVELTIYEDYMDSQNLFVTSYEFDFVTKR